MSAKTSAVALLLLIGLASEYLRDTTAAAPRPSRSSHWGVALPPPPRLPPTYSTPLLLVADSDFQLLVLSELEPVGGEMERSVVILKLSSQALWPVFGYSPWPLRSAPPSCPHSQATIHTAELTDLLSTSQILPSWHSYPL